jgi:hypothetical protein
MDKRWYFMRGDKGPIGTPFQLADSEVQPLRDKDWLVVPAELVKPDVHGHFHVVDEHGQLIGQRMLDAIQAGEHRRLGHHLVHVGDASKDMDEVRAIQASLHTPTEE